MPQHTPLRRLLPDELETTAQGTGGTRRSSTAVRAGEGSQQAQQITGLLGALLTPAAGGEQQTFRDTGIPFQGGPGFLGLLEGPARSLSITSRALGRAVDEVIQGRSARTAAANVRRGDANLSREFDRVSDAVRSVESAGLGDVVTGRVAEEGLASATRRTGRADQFLPNALGRNVPGLSGQRRALFDEVAEQQQRQTIQGLLSDLPNLN